MYHFPTKEYSDIQLNDNNIGKALIEMINIAFFYIGTHHIGFLILHVHTIMMEKVYHSLVISIQYCYTVTVLLHCYRLWLVFVFPSQHILSYR